MGIRNFYFINFSFVLDDWGEEKEVVYEGKDVIEVDFGIYCLFGFLRVYK